jgi:hypothetical protein
MWGFWLSFYGRGIFFAFSGGFPESPAIGITLGGFMVLAVGFADSGCRFGLPIAENLTLLGADIDIRPFDFCPRLGQGRAGNAGHDGW